MHTHSGSDKLSRGFKHAAEFNSENIIKRAKQVWTQAKREFSIEHFERGREETNLGYIGRGLNVKLSRSGAWTCTNVILLEHLGAKQSTTLA